MQQHWGTGSRSSPIALLDDSEEEVIQELTPSQFYASVSAPHQEDEFSQASPAYDTMLEKKRKRQDEPEPEPFATSSALPPLNQASPFENRLSRKRLRKRRRKLQNQVEEEQRTEPLNWLNHPPFLPPKPVTTGFPLQDEPSLFARMSEQRHGAISGYDYVKREGSVSYLDYGYDDDRPQSSYTSYSPLLPPSSSWVSSMTKVAGTVIKQRDENEDEDDMWSPYAAPVSPPPVPPSLSPPPPLPPPLALPPKPPTPSIPVQVHSLDDNRTMAFPDKITSDPTSASTPLVPETRKPRVEPAVKASTEIGQAPDLDPSSKHGTFKFDLSQPHSHLKIMQRPFPSYAPNPARTLVMEQVPKAHRSIPFVGDWARKASGGFPAKQVIVDTQSSKALVEFATAEQARKAFSSPRLNQEMKSIPTHLLKGKPRIDLIRVWWYRVAGVGADAGVGEIEEGEIEDDQDGLEVRPPDVVLQVQVDEAPPEAPLPHLAANIQEAALPPKETKKQRKARLARAREQKQEQKQVQNRVQAIISKMQTTQADIAVLPPQAVYSVSSSASSSSLVPPFVDLPPLPPLPHELPPPLPSFLPSGTPYPFDAPLPFASNTPLDVLAQYPPPEDPPHIQALRSTGQHRPFPSSSHNSLPSWRAPPPHISKQVPQDEFALDFQYTPGSAPKDAIAKRHIGPPPTLPIDDLADYEDVQMDVDQPAPSSGSREHNDRAVRHKGPLLHPSLPSRPNPSLMRPPSPPLGLRSEKSSGCPNSLKVKVAGNQKRIVSRELPSPTMVLSTPAVAPPSTVSGLATPLPQNPPEVKPPGVSSQDGSNLPPSIDAPLAPNQQPPQFEVDGLSKQALLLKERLLHEKIARSRVEFNVVAPKPVQPSSTVPPVGAAQPMSPMSQVQASIDNPTGPSQAMEDSLRKMVLATKKANTKATQADGAKTVPVLTKVPVVALPTPPPSAPLGHLPQTSSRQPSPPRAPLPPKPTTQPPMSSMLLEELAVSFITETIETVRSKPISSSTSSGSTVPSTSSTPPPFNSNTPTAQSNNAVQVSSTTTSTAGGGASHSAPPSALVQLKAQLALKQKRLELHIEESKSLMGRVAKASTKPEKDLLMKILREKTRLFEEQNKATERLIAKLTAASTTQASAITTNTRSSNRKPPLSRWPSTTQEQVLIMSDSEDDEM